MKTSTQKLLKAFILFSPLFLFSCKKDNTLPTNSSVVSSDNISEADAQGIYKTTSGYTKLVLQPGDGVGQDTWIDFFDGYDSSIYNNGNAGPIDQIKCNAWTMFGGTVVERSLIRFDELSQVSSSSQLISARLFLYGIDDGSQLPQGNSYYPGSPYDIYGPNDIYVKRITSPWDENSVTWNTQPGTTVNGESLIAPSTAQWNYNTSVDVSKQVNYFIKNPSLNYGLMLSLVKEDIYRCMGFCSSENSDALKRPKLILIYK